ncbi:MAG: hypothetical protein H7172_08625 [Ferruginibacter sp.]|nr:hypothetical protein [Rhodoferax sp.]
MCDRDAGHVTLVEGHAYRQMGSDVLVPAGHVTVAGHSVAIIEARKMSRSTREQRFSQRGLIEVAAAIGAGAGVTDPSANASGAANNVAAGAAGANAANAMRTKSTTGAAAVTPLVIRTTNLRQWLSSDYLLNALG